jgi:glycerophosphoryl diester phosphodiesterase
MAGLDWLTARPIAHRGLHDIANNIVENTASAFSAAIAGNYGIECDLQISADGEAMVHHDDALGRLTEGAGTLASMTAADIRRAAFRRTSDRIMTLGELCDLVAARSVLVIEMKSRFAGDTRLPARVAQVLRGYAGPVAVMSFDPGQIVALAEAAPGLPRGIVAESRYDHPEWKGLSGWQKFQLAHLLHGLRTKPHFIAYGVKDLPAFAPLFARMAFGLPLLTWTVRNEADRKRAGRYASQMIFEGFRP